MPIHPGHHGRVLRAGQPAVQAGGRRAGRQQVHRVLHAVPRRRRGQGHQPRHIAHPRRQEPAVRRLVSDRFQGGHQLPAARTRRLRLGRTSRRRPGRVHDVQHDGHRNRMGPAVPQVRRHVQETRVRPLVRGRGHGKFRVLGSARGHRSVTARLQGAGAVAVAAVPPTAVTTVVQQTDKGELRILTACKLPVSGARG